MIFFSISEIPDLVEAVRAQINRIKDEASKDDDGTHQILFLVYLFGCISRIYIFGLGLYIIPTDDKFNSILNIVEDIPIELWKVCFVLVLSTLLFSTFSKSLRDFMYHF
jgi:hypothetical protein